MSKENCTDTIALRQDQPLPTTRDLIAGAAGHVTAAFGRLVSWQQQDRMRKHLAAMDDRLLADIGLTRADVEGEISKPFWQA